MDKAWKRLAIILLITILPVEGVAYLSTRVLPDLYDNREAAIARLDESKYQHLIKYNADADLGWDQSPTTITKKNCAGTITTYHNDPNRFRRSSSGLNPLDAVVVTAGDSFTYGTDADDDKTYPAFLEKMLNAPVANIGVSGYDSLQSLLKLEKKISLFPHAKVVVLGIMYGDDLLHMSNSNMWVFWGAPSSSYNLKPYMQAGKIIPLNPNFMQSFAQMKEDVIESFDNDYYARPVAKFPYTVSLIESLGSNPFRLYFLSGLAQILHKPHYNYMLAMPDMEINYISLLQHYADFAKAHGLKPVLALIPQSGDDATTGDLLIATAKQAFGDTLTYVSVGPGVDFDRYNLTENRKCHPSPYGYEMIAEAVAKGVKTAGLH